MGAGSKIIDRNPQKDILSHAQVWIGVAFAILWGLIYLIKTYREDKFEVDM